MGASRAITRVSALTTSSCLFILSVQHADKETALTSKHGHKMATVLGVARGQKGSATVYDPEAICLLSSGLRVRVLPRAP